MVSSKRVDVVVCTYNSEKFLDACLKSIYRSIPVRTLFVIDNNSVDGTVKIARSYGAEITCFSGSLCEARKLSFNLATTEVFASVDSDVVLCDDWFSLLYPFMKGNVGVVCGVPIDQHPLHKAFSVAIHKVRPGSLLKQHYFSNALLRKSVLCNIVFPLILKSGSVASEDLYLINYVKKLGFQCVTVPAFSRHYCNPPALNVKTYWYGGCTRAVGGGKLGNVLYRFAFSFPQALLASLVAKNPLVFTYYVKYRFQIFYGYLHWSKYLKFER